MKKERLSNIELLRILSMFMILGLHANFVALPRPDNAFIIANPIESSLRIFLEYLCIVSVDVFVLISGWFRIKATTRSITNFLYQIVFFWGGL